MTALTNHKVEHARINKHGYYSQWDKIKRDFGEEIRRSSVEAIAVLVSANKTSRNLWHFLRRLKMYQ